MIYVVYRLKDKDYTIDNISKYMNKINIPCPFAVFTQNLKYLCEQEHLNNNSNTTNITGYTPHVSLQDTLNKNRFLAVILYHTETYCFKTAGGMIVYFNEKNEINSTRILNNYILNWNNYKIEIENNKQAINVPIFIGPVVIK